MALRPTTRYEVLSAIGAGGALAAGLPPTVVAIYIFVRLAIPVLLIALAARGATAAQVTSLVRTYLVGSAQRRSSGD